MGHTGIPFGMDTDSVDDVDPEREVRRLHLMLGDWFAGVRDDVEPLENAMARDFTAITPDGVVHDAGGYVDALAAERGELERARLEVEDIAERRSMYDLHQLTFVKVLRSTEGEERRTCSIWVRETNRTATGLQLLHLQETRQPVAEGD